MHLNFWLSNLYRQLAGSRIRAGVRGRQKLYTSESATIERLEHRQLLSVGSVMSAGSETLVNSYTSGNQQSPQVASDSRGDYVVTWVSVGTQYNRSEDGSGYGVYAQRYNAAGVAQGGEFRVNSTTANAQTSPSVAMDATGDFVIVWESYDQATAHSHYDIYGQRFNASGAREGGEFQINTYTSGDQTSPAVAMDATGDFVVTWTSQGQNGDDYSTGAYAQRYNSSGTREGSAFLVSTSTMESSAEAVVAMDAAGGFVIAWTQSFSGLLAQRFSKTGVAQGSEIVVGGNVGAHSVAMDSTGDFVVAFHAYTDGPGTFDSIFAERYNASGIEQGTFFQVNTFGASDQQDPSVSMDSAGDFAIAWQSNNQDGDSWGIYARGYSAAGAAQGAELKINSYTTGSQTSPSVAMDSTGDFVVAWTSNGQDRSYNGAYAHRFKLSVPITNHAPVGTARTVSTLEDVAYTFKAGDFGFTDPNDNPPNTLLAVKITTLPSVGSLTDNGIAVTAGQFVSVTDISGGKLKFTPVAKRNGAAYASFTFQVQDNGGTANGGINTDPTARKMTVSVTSVNNAPVGTSGTVTAVENTPYKFKTSDFGFTDPGDSPPNALLAVKFTLLPTAGTLTDSGVAVTVNQFVSATDISGGKLVFTPKANLTGGPLFLCKFQVEDNGGTTNGGVNLDPNAKILDVKITSLNHAPVGTSATVTGIENTAYKIKTTDFGFKDPNDNPPDTLLAVKVTVLPTAGTLTDNGVAVTVNQLVSASDISSGKLVFTPKANLVGGPFVLCKFQVEDNGGTASGGVNLDPTPKILDINIVHVNHAPVGTSGTVAGTENTPYKFKTTDFGFTDPNDSPANTLLAVKFTLLPTLGTFTDNGIAVAVNQIVSASDISSGKLVFTPKANLTGGPYFLCKFQVEDNGGTANGGVNLDPTAKVLDIRIKA